MGLGLRGSLSGLSGPGWYSLGPKDRCAVLECPGSEWGAPWHVVSELRLPVFTPVAPLQQGPLPGPLPHAGFSPLGGS